MKLKPAPGELVQGVVFAALTAVDHFKAAEILFDQELTGPGYSSLISALEELGKIKHLCEALITWTSSDKASEFAARQKNHPWKLSGALAILSGAFAKGGSNFRFTGVIAEWLQGGDPVDFVLTYLDPKAAQNYHELRLRVSYSNFDGQRAVSPLHSLHRIEPQLLKMSATLIRKTIEKLLSIADQLLPIYMEPIRKCYRESDPQKVTNLKVEINRRINRTLPIFKQTLDRSLLAETGRDLEYWAAAGNEEMKTAIARSCGDMMTFMKNIASLIVSDDKIEQASIDSLLVGSAQAGGHDSTALGLHSQTVPDSANTTKHVTSESAR